jgi:cyclase
MSFVRLIPVLTLKDGRIIKTVSFDQYRDIGHPKTMGKVFDSQDVDELIFLDITASQERREPDWVSIVEFAEECVMPLTVGGGVSRIEHIRKLLQIGADKVTVNTAAVRDPDFVTRAAEVFGTQCIVVSVDAKRQGDGRYEVLVEGGYEPTGLDPVAFARDMARRGAGEIMINSIDRDGTMQGYDLELVRRVADAVDIPVIACGGCGELQDLVEVVNIGHASAAACSSLFAFTDNKPIKAKAFMQTAGINIRPI